MRGAAKSWDWQHIMDAHSEEGLIAKQRKKPDQVFRGMSQRQIKVHCQKAWKKRKKVGTQVGPDDVERVCYRGTYAGRKVEFWYNTQTSTVETAFPVGET